MLKPDTLAMTIVLALLTGLGPMSTDMYLPSLPEIGRSFGVSPSEVQLTLSAYLIGFAGGQVVYGPISDRIGRKPMLVAGLLVYGAASLLCAASWSIEALIGARFLQAVGASGPIVIARAVVRDLYEGERAGRELSRMGTVMGLLPAIAPTVGAVLEVWFGWRSSFTGAMLLAVVATALVARLPETLRRPDPTPLSFLAILAGFRALLRERHFRRHAALLGATFGSLFAFISGSSHVLQGLYGLGEIAFGLAFGACALTYVVSTVVSRRLLPRLGMTTTIEVGCGFLALGGVCMALAVAFGPHHAAVIVLPAMIFNIGLGLGFPLSQALALMPYADRAGAASSLIGIIQMSVAAFVGIVVTAGVDSSPWTMVATLNLLAMAAVVAVWRIARGGRG